MLPIGLGAKLGAVLTDPECCMPTKSQHAGGVADDDLWWRASPPGSARTCLVVRAAGLEVSLAPILKPKLEVVALGRRDFLAAFKFAVDERSETFRLEPYEEPANDWLRRMGRMDP
jgi:hypothetical protein